MKNPFFPTKNIKYCKHLFINATAKALAYARFLQVCMFNNKTDKQLDVCLNIIGG